MRQGFLSYGLPMKEFERRLNERQIHHQGNPALRFCADNVVVVQDAAGLLKPAKDKSRNKIDGISALVMAFDWLSRAEESGPWVAAI
jgi:phage terminase large subunit-like protein